MAMQNTEQKYRHLVENSLQGIVIVQDFKIVYSNPAFSRITGYTVEELLDFDASKLINLVHPDDQELVWGNFRNRMAGHEISPHYKFKGMTKDGRQKILDLYASVIEYDGRPALQALFLDITDQIEAEEKLQHRTRLIEKIVDSLPIGIAVNESETGKNIFTNNELRNILGLQENEILSVEKILAK